MKQLLSLLLILFLVEKGVAQYQVNDSTTQALLSTLNQQTANNQSSILQQWTTSFGKLDSQIQKLNSLVTVAGNPSQALGQIGGIGNLGKVSSTISQGQQLADQIRQTANGAQSLADNGQGLFKSIPSSLSGGISIPRDTTAYNKFSAYEQNFKQLNSTLQTAQTNRQNLLSELQNVLATNPGDAAGQQAQLVKISAINGELLANDQLMKQIQAQTQAQNEANNQDADKQRQALAETIYAQDQQMSKLGASYSKTLLNQR